MGGVVGRGGGGGQAKKKNHKLEIKKYEENNFLSPNEVLLPIFKLIKL
jgi:hypothetical protein